MVKKGVGVHFAVDQQGGRVVGSRGGFYNDIIKYSATKHVTMY